MSRLLRRTLSVFILIACIFIMKTPVMAAVNISNSTKLQVVPSTTYISEKITCDTSAATLQKYFDVYYGTTKWTWGEDYVFSVSKYCGYTIGEPSNPNDGITWTFRVIALGDGYEGQAYVETTMLTTVTNLTVNNCSTGLKLNWDKSYGAFGYRIYRRMNDGSYSRVKTINNRSTVTWTDTSATNVTAKYTYYIVAFTYSKYDVAVTVKASNRATGILLAPPTVKCSNHASGIKVSWSKSAYADRYLIYRAASDNGTYSKIAEISGNSTLYYIDRSAPSGWCVINYYRVYAVKGNVKSLTQPSIAYARIKRPTNVSLTKSGTSLTVKFSDSNADSDDYQIQIDTNSSFSNYKRYTVTKTSKTISNLVKGKTYYVRIRTGATSFTKRSSAGFGIEKLYSAWTAVQKITM